MARRKQLAGGGTRSWAIAIVALVTACALSALFASAASAARARHNCLPRTPRHAVHARRRHRARADASRRGAHHHRARVCIRRHRHESVRTAKRRSSTASPTAPTALSSVAGNAQVALTWGASTDSLGVAGYRVYRNNERVAQIQLTRFTDTGLTNGTSYSYYVVAYDSAGNVSAPSNTVWATPATTTTTTTTTISRRPRCAAIYISLYLL